MLAIGLYYLEVMNTKKKAISTIQKLYKQEFNHQLCTEDAKQIIFHLNELYVWLLDLTSQPNFELPTVSNTQDHTVIEGT